MPVATRRRLPGVEFARESVPPAEVLPRMDVAAFVGFAASGPLDTPVAVDDVAAFTEVFGPEAPLYRDPETGEIVPAHLNAAVRAFFRNGGRRCHVVRVAGHGARTASFSPPGLVRRRRNRAVVRAQLPARSPGSWADGLRVATALSAEPVQLRPRTVRRLEFVAPAGGASPLAPGDLLRIRLRSRGITLLFAVAETRLLDGGEMLVLGDRDTDLWLRPRRRSPVGLRAVVAYAGADGTRHTRPARIAEAAGPVGRRSMRLVLEVQADASAAPVEGALLRTDLPDLEDVRPPWVLVDSVRAAPGTALGDRRLLVAGEAFWPALPPRQEPPLEYGDPVERLTFELWVRRGATERYYLAGLGFAPGHPRYVGDLPSDAALFALREGEPPSSPPPLWADAAHPRFPLAGPGERAGVFFPLGMPTVPQPIVPHDRTRGSALLRDGLARYSSEPFVDSQLADVGTEALIGEADHLRYQARPRRALKGMHALLALDEATMVAVPDAVHPGWRWSEPAAPPPPRRVRPPAARARAGFRDCATGELPVPDALDATTPDRTGSFALWWAAVEGPEVSYVVEESADRDFGGAATLPAGGATRLDVYGRPPGAWYYRVRTESGRRRSPWSDGIVVQVGRAGGWFGLDADGDAVLLDVQRALLRMCAARGDLFALLSLPRRHREDEVVQHLDRLRAALTGTERRALGYAAVYHPWPTTSDPDRPELFRAVPPDGASAGVMASRARTRGAWVAPANEVLSDVVTLNPVIAPAARQRLQDAGLNLLRQEARGFLWLNADTLSDDPELRHVNVRRLLILLRRTALLRGGAYVFEPAGDALRRRVASSFRSLLLGLHSRGAFAGRTPEASFRVEVSSPPNTRQSVDQGRLIVELKIAPSVPMRFLDVRLVHRDDRGFRIEGP